RRLRVGIADVWRQGIGDVAFLRHAFKAPVQRNTDGFHLLTMHVQRLQTTGDHSDSANKTTLAAYLHAIAVGNAFRFRQLFAYLLRLFRLRDGIQQRVLGSGVEMLGQAVGRSDIWELVLFAQTQHVVLVNTHNRAGDHVRVQR